MAAEVKNGRKRAEPVKKLAITDERMLLVMKYCVANKIQGISVEAEFAEVVGLGRTNIDNVKKARRKFTVEQIRAARKIFNVNLDFIFGMSDTMFNQGRDKAPIDALKEAVKAVEIELLKK